MATIYWHILTYMDKKKREAYELITLDSQSIRFLRLDI